MSLEYTMGERYIKEDVLKGCVGRNSTLEDDVTGGLHRG